MFEVYIESKKLAEALRSDESKPEDKDSDGHWGMAEEGLRLSLRFARSQYTNGEPIVAKVLLRNVARQKLECENVLGPEWDFHFAVWRGPNGRLQEDRSGEPSGTTGAKHQLVYLRTQRRFLIRLDGRFDFTAPGIYSIVVKTKVPKADKQGLVEISSGTAQLEVLNAQLTGTNSSASP